MRNVFVGPKCLLVLYSLFCLSLGFACSTTDQEPPLESSEEFLASLDPEPTNSNESAELGSDGLVEDFAIEKNYQSFDPSDIEIKFEFDSAELSADNTKALLSVVEGLNKDPLAKVFVRGHADKQGPEGYNDYLSQKRAKVIFNFLTERGIDETRLIVIHLGESEPLVDANTVVAFKKNRRGDFNLDYSHGAFSK